MIKLKIESKLLRALPAGLSDAELASVRKSAGGHVRKAVQKNFRELVGKTGSRKWWGKAVRQTVLAAREEEAARLGLVRDEEVPRPGEDDDFGVKKELPESEYGGEFEEDILRQAGRDDDAR